MSKPTDQPEFYDDVKQSDDELLSSINERISKEICSDTIDKLKDENLLTDYKKCSSVMNNVKILEDVLTKHDVCKDKVALIINDYMLKLIPAGTKGVIKGNKFNQIVKKFILDMNLDIKKFEVRFEKQCATVKTSEIPDWYILDKTNDKVIIGMNQLDLWKGGHQLNRGSKYILSNSFDNVKTKLVCVVCNLIQFKNDKSKAFNLFKHGYEKNTLCHLNGLKVIITNFLTV
jgi:hypothetical protein